MAVNLSMLAGAGAQFFDNSGVPLAGGLVYTYAAGTTTPQTTYTSSAGNIAHTNPIVLNSAGRVAAGGEIWLTDAVAYKFVLETATAVTIATYDNVTGNASGISSSLAASSGSALVGYLPAGAGAVATTVQAKLRETVSVKDFGAVGDGTTDDTVAIQAAVLYGYTNGVKLYFNDGSYLLSNSITCGSNLTVEFDAGVVINLVAADIYFTPVFNMANQTNNTFIGNGCSIIGRRGTAYVEGKASAFYLFGSDNIYIENFNISDFATTGISITGDNTGSGSCTRITIANCNSSNCNRNAMEIISAKDCLITGGSYNTANGATSGPWAGIDIEPNSNCFIDNINIIGVTTQSNDGCGIQFTPGAMPNNSLYNVNVFGHRSVSDGLVSATGTILGASAIGFKNADTYVTSAVIQGTINYTNSIIENSYVSGVFFNSWASGYMPFVTIRDITIINPGSTTAAAIPTSSAGVCIFVSTFITNATSKNYGGIKIDNITVIDNRAVKKLSSAVYFQSGVAGAVLNNIQVSNVTATGNTVSGSSVYIGWNTNLSFTNFAINNPNQIVPVAVNEFLYHLGGSVVNVTGTCTLTLPPAANFTNFEFNIQNANGVSSVTLKPYAGDNLGFVNGSVADAVLVLDENCVITVRSMSSTNWVITNISGQYRIQGAATTRRTNNIYKATIPTTGTWALGDVCTNSSPAIGSPKSWVCTVAGTPGTWVSTGNL